MAIPILEIKSSKKPIAIIKGGDRRLHFYKVNRFADKMFATREGLLFELDDRYEYRYRRTSIYIYNFSNSKPLLLSGMNEIDVTLKEHGQSELLNVPQYIAEMRQMQSQIQRANPQAKMEPIQTPPDIVETFLPSTRRFIQDYSSDDERAKTEMMIKVHTLKKPIDRYSSELLGMGINHTDFAIVQIAHKKLDIVPMFVHDNRAYTAEYGIFEYTLDNVYYVNKQAVAFFILNSNESETIQPIPRGAQKKMKSMIKHHGWNNLETYKDPRNTKLKPDKEGYTYALVPLMLREDPEIVQRLENEKRKLANKIKAEEEIVFVDEDGQDVLKKDVPVVEPIVEEEEIVEEKEQEPELETEPEIETETYVDPDPFPRLEIMEATLPPR